MRETDIESSLRPVMLPLAVLVMIQIAASGAFVTVQVVAPAVAAAHGLPVALIGVFTSLAYAGAMLSSPATDAMIARFGAPRACQITLLVCAAGLAVCTLGWPLTLVAGAFVLGLGHGPVTPLSSHVLMLWTPPRVRGSVFSLKQAAVPLGGVVAGAMAPAVAVALGWQAGILSMAALGVGVALVVEPLRGRLDGGRSAPDGARPRAGMIAALRVVIDDPALFRLIWVSCVFGALQWCFSTFFVAFLVEELRMPLVTAGLAFAVSQAGGIGGRILWGVVTDRRGSADEVLAGLGFAMAAASIALAFAGPAWPGWVVVLLALAIGLSAFGWNGVLLAELARLAPDGRVASATAGFIVVFALSTILVPIAFSLLTLLGSYGPGFALLGLACLATGWRLLAARPGPGGQSG
jgi:MFS family permease